MELSREQAEEIIWSDSENFVLIKNKITETSRWSEFHYVVFKDKVNDKYYSTHCSTSLTEMQDEGPWEHDEPEITEVFPKEVTVIKYVTKENL